MLIKISDCLGISDCMEFVTLKSITASKHLKASKLVLRALAQAYSGSVSSQGYHLWCLQKKSEQAHISAFGSFRLNVGNAAHPEQGTCLTQRPFCFLLWSSGKIHFLWQHKHNHWWCSGKFSKTKQFTPSFSPVPSQMWVKSFFTRQTFCYGNTHLW